MRTDPNKDQDFVYSKEWQSSGRLPFYGKDKDGKNVSNSFSGNERDHLYLNRGGKSFLDVSGISGLDLVTDGRSFACLDYDRDGWLDVALASANAPQLQVLHNDLAALVDGPRNHIRIRLRGGNTADAPSATHSNRDGYGARLTATLDNGLVLYREHVCGTGMAAQNSSVIHLGIGTAASVRKLEVTWPSGKSQTIENLRPGKLHEIREVPE